MFSKSSLQGIKDVRTNEQHKEEITMLTELKAVLSRSSDTLAGDAAGAAALVILLIVGLYLPAVV